MYPDSVESNKLLHGKAKRFGPGYVYLVKQVDANYCKIGLSISPEYRLTQIDYAVPFEVTMLHTILVPNMKAAEDMWHRIFARWRKKGEWFLLTDDAIRLFCSCTGRHELGLEYEIYVVNQWYWGNHNGA